MEFSVTCFLNPVLEYEVINIFRINDIIDLPVVDSISAQRLCTIRDVIIDLRESRIYALICKEKFFGKSLEAVPFRSVTAISQNNVTVTGRISLISLRELRMKQRRYQSYQSILGKLVQCSKGETLGAVRDLLIDTNSGIIKAYELSEGYIDDFLRGRHIIEMDSRHILNGENVVLNEYNTQSMIKT